MKTITYKRAERIRREICQLMRIDPDTSSGPVLHTAEHECMSRGSWSIAYEGYAYDWPFNVTQDPAVQRAANGVFLEPVNGCTLGLYPDGE